MKHTIKISGVILGMALAMTVAYARTEERSGQSLVQRDASMQTSQITIPPALRLPASIRSCDAIGGFCSTFNLCHGTGGVVVAGTECSDFGEICCVYE